MRATAEQRSLALVRNDSLVPDARDVFTSSVGFNGLAVCRWCDTSSPVQTSPFYKGAVNESPRFSCFVSVVGIVPMMLYVYLLALVANL